ncbi:zincin-like metallopeptidase domain-containing protein [Priestia megaterium]
MNVKEIITDRIIKDLEKGEVPWRKPWYQKNFPTRWVTNEPYRGINLLLLKPGEYATKKQILEAGGQIKKEEFGNYHIAVYWGPAKKASKKKAPKKEEKEELKEQDEIESKSEKKKKKLTATNYEKFVLRYYRVYEINYQCTGLQSKIEDKEELDFNPIEKAEEIIDGYKNKPLIKTGAGGAYYRPSKDYINMPSEKTFHSVEEYYSTLFHEAIHSTGHKKRLDREGIIDIAAFGSETYSKEELVAEIGAAMLCGLAGIEDVTFENSIAYLQSWIKALKEDSSLVPNAAQQAQKAFDHILGVSFEEME